jgi:hypothetical protein
LVREGGNTRAVPNTPTATTLPSFETATATGDPAKPDTFETRFDNMVISSGAMMWNASGQLETFEVLINVLFIPHARFDYEYNADGSLMRVTGFNIEENPEELIGTYDFAYPFPQVTVTYVFADATVISILTYDFVCPP